MSILNFKADCELEEKEKVKRQAQIEMISQICGQAAKYCKFRMVAFILRFWATLNADFVRIGNSVIC